MITTTINGKFEVPGAFGAIRSQMDNILANMRSITSKKIIKNAMNRVQMRDDGLILWENEALALISISISILGQKYIKTCKKYAKMFQSMSLGICATCIYISE